MTLEHWQQEILEKGELYCVGGDVRDELFGVQNIDFDIDYLVRGISPEDLEKILNKHGRVAFVGKSFGVYKFKPPDATQEIDIAYPRTEISTGTGHTEFDVNWDWTLPIEEDLGRRDFTINSIAKDIKDGRLVDPYNGRRDIEDRVLRMVFGGAFLEDPLRILRGVRFAARFSLRIDEATKQSMKDAASLVGTISAERIQEEFTKLFTQCDCPSKGLAMMQEIGVLEHTIPELSRGFGVEQNEFHPDDVFWHSLKSLDKAPRSNLLVRWAALLHDLGKVDKKKTVEDGNGGEKVVFYGHEKESAEIAKSILDRLRYGRDFVRECVHLVENHMFLYRDEWNRGTVRRFIQRIGKGNLDDLYALRAADCLSREQTEELERLDALRKRVADEIKNDDVFKITDLAIDGGDVIRVLGVEPGSEVGRILHEVLEEVLDDPGLNNKDRLVKLLEEKHGGEKKRD